MKTNQEALMVQEQTIEVARDFGYSDVRGVQRVLLHLEQNAQKKTP